MATDIPCYKERFGETACYLLLFLDAAEYSAHVLQAQGHGMILWTGGRGFLSLFTVWQPKSLIGRGN